MALAATPIELTPEDVGSTSVAVFSTLPTVSPAVYGLSGGDVRGINFDVDTMGSPLPSGTILTDQFASLGVDMNGIVLSSAVFQGAASPPNATLFDSGHVFNFTVPVVAAGIVNTSPDKDLIQFWSGPNGTGELLLEFRDQEGIATNFNIDRFVGARMMGSDLIGSMLVSNASGNLELDELIFEVTVVTDTDQDTIPDGLDNCTLVSNTNQRDSNEDGFGNVCDMDLDNNGVVNFLDLVIFSDVFLSDDMDADANGDGTVNFLDFITLSNSFLMPPGPSGVAP